MSKIKKIGLAQINPVIADVAGNRDKIIAMLQRGREEGVDIIAFPEMITIGYPAQDLLFRREIIDSNIKALREIIPHTKGYLAAAIGYCRPLVEGEGGQIDRQHLFNAYALCSDGQLIGEGEKACLPNYGVFDDYRYFIPGREAKVHEVDGTRVGVAICEDLWYRNDEPDHPIYPFRPVKSLAEQGADVVLVLNASPYHVGKELIKDELVSSQAKANQVPVFYVNMWGGNDKIIFDGNSLAADKEGDVILRAAAFEDDLAVVELDLETGKGAPLASRSFNEAENLFQALVVGKRDYHRKCGLGRSVVGVSGGIDSAVVLALDVAALGRENVLAVLSPSRWSSEGTLNDSIRLCENLGVEYLKVPIEEQNEAGEWVGVIPEKYRRYIKYVGQPEVEVVFENQQAIDRMSILRGIANEGGRLVSGTGNKSELATGYATVCGDLQADILVIGDLYKGQVYDVARHVNKLHGREVIPVSILERAPSAELAPDQVDPFDYERLDHLVKLKVEDYLSDQEILEHAPSDGKKFTADEVARYSRLIDLNEHKRFKSGYILKVSPVAFGEDRRVNTAKKVSLIS